MEVICALEIVQYTFGRLGPWLLARPEQDLEWLRQRGLEGPEEGATAASYAEEADVQCGYCSFPYFSHDSSSKWWPAFWPFF